MPTPTQHSKITAAAFWSIMPLLATSRGIGGTAVLTMLPLLVHPMMGSCEFGPLLGNSNLYDWLTNPGGCPCGTKQNAANQFLLA